jgi:4-hydroxybenzoate polyprenyltransferase
MNKVLNFLIHSNIYLGLSASAVAYLCMVLLGMPIFWQPMAIAFCVTFFLYSLNRYTDMEEDRINYPGRVKFIKSSGKPVFYFSAALYAFSLYLALTNSIASFMIALAPFILVFSYSVIRLKKLLVLKNLIVAFGWAMVAFLALSYTHPATYFEPLSMSVFMFFFIRVLIDTVAFDAQDVEGDKVSRVRTIANTFGINKVKTICHALNIFMIVFFMLAWNFDISSMPITANLIIIWSFLYMFLINRFGVRGITDVISEGELILLGIVVFVIQNAHALFPLLA